MLPETVYRSLGRAPGDDHLYPHCARCGQELHDCDSCTCDECGDTRSDHEEICYCGAECACLCEEVE